ncbi:MAG: hypothetical protein LR120_11390 [Dehalococcoidia bacterium]|nr:hypothetical protein [Dehalococcoidia bacterium]
MRILLLGVNHKTVPLDVREAVSFSKSEVIEALSTLQDIAGEAVVLSMCNRTEIYVTAADEKKVSPRIGRFIRWWESSGAEPMVHELRIQAEDIRQQEIARTLKRVDGLDDEQREVSQSMTRSIVNRVLHDPTMFLKDEADTSELDAARMLFHPCGPEKS